jgi:hypothetical protein
VAPLQSGGWDLINLADLCETISLADVARRRISEQSLGASPKDSTPTDSQKHPTAMATTTTTPSRRKQHQPSSSLGSLYEVLADLDETQLHYLIQEMSHTGHQNVPVSQAVSAFESDNATDSLDTLRASMLPPCQGVQRQLSKSQRGKLRLQTAFQRAPSLRQRRLQGAQVATQPARSDAAPVPKDASIDSAAKTGGHPRSQHASASSRHSKGISRLQAHSTA